MRAFSFLLPSTFPFNLFMAFIEVLGVCGARPYATALLVTARAEKMWFIVFFFIQIFH